MIEVKTLEPLTAPKGTVLLGHAMFNSIKYFFRPKGNSIAEFLVSAGYRVVAFNLTGYGESDPASPHTNFDSYVSDYKSVIAGLPEDAPLHFIGHSVGSLAGLSAIAISSRQFRTMTVACPAIWGHTATLTVATLAQKFQLRLASVLLKKLDLLPAKLLGLGDTDAPAGYMQQLERWSASGHVTSDAGLDYPSAWKKVNGLIMVLEAAKDPWMATPANISWVMDNLPTSATRLRIDAQSSGFVSQHFTILYGRNAKDHVWPKLLTHLGR
jgi:predicted alpha/beta hydrolase